MKLKQVYNYIEIEKHFYFKYLFSNINVKFINKQKKVQLLHTLFFYQLKMKLRNILLTYFRLRENNTPV